MFDFLKASKWAGGGPVGQHQPKPGRDAEEARICAEAGNLEEAERLLLRAIEQVDQRPADRLNRAKLRLDLAELRRQKVAPQLAGNALPIESRRELLAPAERTVREALEIVNLASDPGEFVDCLDALANVFADAEDFSAVEKVAREALRIGAALPDPDVGPIAARTLRLGVALHNLGRSEEASKQLERALELHEKRHGLASLDTGKVLAGCGAIFRVQGHHERAKQCLQRALRIHEEAYGADSAETLAVVQQFAGVLEESGDVEAAAYQYERSLTMKTRKLGFGNLEAIAEMQYQLANLHIGWGNTARARELLEECIGEFRRHGGPRLAVALELLAQLEETLGNYNIAVQELEKAGNAWEKCGPSRAAELLNNLDYRASLLEQLRRTKDAVWLRERMAEIQTTMAVQA